jgi:hypothetical protein
MTETPSCGDIGPSWKHACSCSSLPDLQEREQAPLGLLFTTIASQLAQRIVPSGRQNTRLHVGMNRGVLFGQLRSNSSIATQRIYELSWVYIHVVRNNPQFADYQHPKERKYYNFGFSLLKSHGY